MNYKDFKYSVLCEDIAHFHFVRGWLNSKGVQNRDVFSTYELPHAGSGKSFVQNNYEESLIKFKAHSTYKPSSILIVVIDADNKTTEDVANMFKGHEDLKVFFVVAKWSLDTWMYFLDNYSENFTCKEDTSYKTHCLKKMKHGKLGKILASKDIEKMKNAPSSLSFTYSAIKAKKQKLGLS